MALFKSSTGEIMWSWKWNGSRLLKRRSSRLVQKLLAVNFFILLGIQAGYVPKVSAVEDNHLGASLTLKLTLIGLSSYRDMQEIRAAILQSEGVQKMSLDSEAPGLITFVVKYAGEPVSLIEKLDLFFSKKYKITQKNSSSGISEVNISLR